MGSGFRPNRSVYYFASSFRKLFQFLTQRLDRQQLLIALCISIGITSGIVAILLKSAVHYINELLLNVYEVLNYKVLIIFSPLVGLLLSLYVVRTFFKGKLVKGLSNVLYSIAQKNSIIERSRIFANFFTSAITVGFGGSCGLEAPIVVIGSGIGSNITKKFGLNYKERTLMLASGAAAGISAVFNAPVAGVIFAMEILLTNVTNYDLIALILSSVAGALCSYFFLREDILFTFDIAQSIGFYELLFYVVMGLFCGLVSLLYARVVHGVERRFSTLSISPVKKALIGGFILAALCLFFPSLLGEGYSSIMKLTTLQPEKIFAGSPLAFLTGNYIWLILLVGATGLLKILAASTTVHAGGNGGNFAPSLFVGAYLGFFFSNLVNESGISELPVVNFMLVGMAGILSGVMHAPLSAIFLIAEISGSYELIVPLMIVSAFAYFMSRRYKPYSMEMEKFATEGKIFTMDKEQNILTQFYPEKIMNTGITELPLSMPVEEAFKILEASGYDNLPVINERKQFKGIIDLFEIQQALGKSSATATRIVGDFCKWPDTVILLHEPKKIMLDKIISSKLNAIPVVEENKFVGFINKNEAFSLYRNTLLKQSGL